MKKIKWPTIQEILEELVNIRSDIRGWDFEETDVRLQVVVTKYDSNGIKYNTEWFVHFGDVSFDTDGWGYWGASTIEATMNKSELRDIAIELLEQAKDDAAMRDLNV